MPPRRRRTAAFSLIELLMVIAVLAILVSIVLPGSDPSLHDQLRAAAQILKTDLAYARSLAVSNNSTYQLAFDTDENRYVLQHTGANATLDALPDSPFREPGDPPDRHVVDFDELPHLGPPVRILAVTSGGVRAASLEFDGLGKTIEPGDKVIWLAAGRGKAMRYITLHVDPATGLVTVEPFHWDQRPLPEWITVEAIPP